MKGVEHKAQYRPRRAKINALALGSRRRLPSTSAPPSHTLCSWTEKQEKLGKCRAILYDYKAILGQNELSDFSRTPDPFSDGLTHFYENQLICSLIFSKTIWILLKTIAKKVNFPPRNHYFGDFHIDHHPMHYSITKKHTLSLHVKNIDI